MTEPIQKVAAAWDCGTLLYHDNGSTELITDITARQLLTSPQIFAGPSTSYAAHNIPDVAGYLTYGNVGSLLPELHTQILDRLADPAAGRSLLIAGFDGRWDGPGEAAQPAYKVGGPSDPHQLLAQLVHAYKKSGSQQPVDVFMLLAQKPDFIDLYVNQLPKGSIIAAVKTPPAEDNSWFKHLARRHQKLGQGAYDWPYTPGAPDLLIDYILSGAPMRGPPRIAVSGHRTQHLHDAWHQLGRREDIYPWFQALTPKPQSDYITHEHVRTFLLEREPTTLQRLDWFKRVRRVEDDACKTALQSRAFLTCRDASSPYAYMLLEQSARIFGRDASSPYAYMLLEQSARIFGPAHSWAQLDAARANENTPHTFIPAPPPNGYVTQNNTPSYPGAAHTGTLVAKGQAKGTRLTPADMAGLPPKIRRIAQSAPGVVRRVLRR